MKKWIKTSKILLVCAVLGLVCFTLPTQAQEMNGYETSSVEGNHAMFGFPKIGVNAKGEYIGVAENYYYDTTLGYNVNKLIISSGTLGGAALSEFILDVAPGANRQVPLSSAINDNGDFIMLAYSYTYPDYSSYIIYGNLHDLGNIKYQEVSPYAYDVFLNSVAITKDGTYIIAAEQDNFSGGCDAVLLKGTFANLSASGFKSSTYQKMKVPGYSGDSLDHYLNDITLQEDGSFVYVGYSYSNGVKRILMGKGTLNDFSTSALQSTVFGDGTTNNGYNYGYDVNINGDYVIGYYENSGSSTYKYRFGNVSNFNVFTVGELTKNPSGINSFKVSINDAGKIVLSGSTSRPFETSADTLPNYEIFVVKRDIKDTSFIDVQMLSFAGYFNNIFDVDLDNDGNIILAGELLIGGTNDVPGEPGIGTQNGYSPVVITGSFDDTNYTPKLFGNPDYPKSQNTSSSFTKVFVLNNNVIVTGSLTTGTKTVSHVLSMLLDSATYTVAFDTDGGSSVSSQSVEDGSYATKPSNPTKTGYTFVNWYTDNTYTTLFDFTTAITEDTTIYGKFIVDQPVEYTVAFDTDGGSSVSSQSVEDGSYATKPSNPTKTGYTFVNWYTDNTYTVLFDFTTAITENTTIYGKFIVDQPVEYTVAFDTDGGSSVSSQSVEDGSYATKPSNPTKTGYTFVNWYTDNTYTVLFDFTTAITEDTTIYGKFIEDEVQEYIVSFHTSNGSSIDDQIVLANERATRPGTTPTKEGYTFTDWYTDATYSELFDFTTPITSNTVIFGKFIAKDANNVLVSFDTDGGTLVPSQNIEMSTLVTRPSNPTKPGHTFVNWYADNTYTTLFDFTIPISVDTIIYGKFTKDIVVPYTVSFDTAGGSNITNQSVNPNMLATRPSNPTKVGYAFVNWYTNNTYTVLFDFATPITTDTIVYGKFVKNVPTPIEPTTPVNPVEPVEPVIPVDPTHPSIPSTPSTPSTPAIEPNKPTMEANKTTPTGDTTSMLSSIILLFGSISMLFVMKKKKRRS